MSASLIPEFREPIGLDQAAPQRRPIPHDLPDCLHPGCIRPIHPMDPDGHIYDPGARP